MTKFYVDSNGNFIGGFDGDTGMVPPNVIQVESAPSDGRSIWDGSQWLGPVIPVDEQVQTAEIKQGISLEDKVEAMWKAFVEGDHSSVDEIQAVRDEAKQEAQATTVSVTENKQP